MHNRGISVDAILPRWNAEDCVNKASESTPTESKNSNGLENSEETASVLLAEDQRAKPGMVRGEDLLANKRQRVAEPMEESSATPLKATESSVLDWLKNFNEGVSAMPRLIETYLVNPFIVFFVR